MIAFYRVGVTRLRAIFLLLAVLTVFVRSHASGAEHSWHYGRSHDLVAATTADGATTKWRHDALGRVVHVTDPKGNVQRRSWDVLGRLVRVEEPGGNVRELGYDAEGRVVRARDRRRDVTLTWWRLGPAHE